MAPGAGEVRSLRPGSVDGLEARLFRTGTMATPPVGPDLPLTLSEVLRKLRDPWVLAGVVVGLVILLVVLFGSYPGRALPS